LNLYCNIAQQGPDLKSPFRRLSTGFKCLIGESLHARNIPPALLPADDAGKGFAGRVDLGEGVKLQASGLADAAILAGKREAAKQVRQISSR